MRGSVLDVAMTFRAMRYLTRPMLVAAHQERCAAGIPDRHAHPPFRTLGKRDLYVVVIAHPFLLGFGDGIPQVRCIIQWAEGGLQWTMDMTVDRFRGLPKLHVEDAEAYRLA
jgi:hypothetical protein